MGVRKTKNWDTVGHLFHTLYPELLDEGAREVLLENAHIYQDSIVGMIESQGEDWAPLTEDWGTRKERLTGQEDTYRFRNEFLEYLQSERSIRYVKGKWAESKVFVGARSDIQHGEISMETLAHVLQYDYERPLFDPAYRRVESKMTMNWKNIVAFLQRAGVM